MGAWCREWQSRGVVDVDRHSMTLAAEVPVADSAALLISEAVLNPMYAVTSRACLPKWNLFRPGFTHQRSLN
jgi:hypothetical protein